MLKIDLDKIKRYSYKTSYSDSFDTPYQELYLDKKGDVVLFKDLEDLFNLNVDESWVFTRKVKDGEDVRVGDLCAINRDGSIRSI